MTYQDFIDKYRLTLTKKQHGVRLDGLLNDMPKGSRHFLCQIHFGEKVFETYYTIGSAVKGFDLEDILYSLALDYSSGEMSPWEFMREFGYEDLDKAEKVYNACVKTANGLKELFSEEQLAEFLACEEE